MGLKITNGEHIFKYNIGSMLQPGLKHEMGGTDSKWESQAPMALGRVLFVSLLQ